MTSYKLETCVVINLILFALVIIITIGCKREDIKEHIMDQTRGREDKADPEIQIAKEEFKKQPYNRQRAAKKLIPLIKIDMSTEEVKELLGSPNETLWIYPLFYSSTLTVRFDIADRVKNISSDIMTEIRMEDIVDKDRTDPEITAAISEFKSQPYRRQEPAKKLIPLIKIGSPKEEIQAFLSGPAEILWDYPVSMSESFFISFDINGKVKEVSY